MTLPFPDWLWIIRFLPLHLTDTAILRLSLCLTLPIVHDALKRSLSHSLSVRLIVLFDRLTGFSVCDPEFSAELCPAATNPKKREKRDFAEKLLSELRCMPFMWHWQCMDTPENRRKSKTG